jgi:HTH-type transcriptional regulator/antitoxin HigA
MILSDKQYSISNERSARLEESANDLQHKFPEPDWTVQAQLDALKSQIVELQNEIREYELLKSGQIQFTKSYSLEDLPLTLIQARIAQGLTQTDLAQKLDMKPQQIQRYESSLYMGASLARLIEVSQILGVKVSGTFEGSSRTDAIISWGKADDLIWQKFPTKEMRKRRWILPSKGVDEIQATKSFFIKAAGPQFASALHRKKIHSGNAPNELALLAWQARILQLAKEISPSTSTFRHDDTWLSELIKLTTDPKGPRKAIDLLKANGIIVVIEKHLPGTYLDGAAMIDQNGNPIIGLTLRHDRLDNFWFVLLHEVGHIYLHLFNGYQFDFFDEEGTSSKDNIEIEADRFALDKLIPPAEWTRCMSRFALTNQAVLLDAERLTIAPSIIAGRIRQERGNYTILSDLVGNGQVRAQLEDLIYEVE